MPIIFAQSLMLFPGVLFGWLDSTGFRQQRDSSASSTTEFSARQLHLHHDRSGDDLLLRLLLDDRPVPAEGNGQPAARLRQLHPRPAARQAHRDYLEKVMMRITYVGAAFLCIIAVIPTR